MVKNEWKSIFRNPLMIVVLLAIIAIPTIYSALFLASMWDPYGNLDKLPVAVVNEDVAVEYNGKTLDIGTQLVDKLKENSELQFNFVDADAAQQGLENGTYYMVITIPENFSANAATLMDDEPQKMQLQYETNPGKNYIASKLSDTALSKIKSSVSEEITKTYSETVFEQLSDIGESLDSASDGTSALEDGMGEISDGNDTITENLKTLAESTLTFAEGSETLEDGVTEYTDGVSKVNDGAKQLDEGAKTLSSSATSGVSELKDGTSSLKSGVESYTSGVTQAAEGAAELNKNSKSLTDGAKQVDEGAKTLSSSATSGVSELKDGTSSLKSGVKSYTKGVSQAASGAAELEENSQSLNDGAAQIYSGAKQLSSGSSAVLSGLQQISSSLSTSLSKENKTQLETLKSGCDSLLSGITKLNKSVSALEIPDLSTAAAGITQPAKTIASDATAAGTNLYNMQGYLQKLAATYPELTADANYLSLCGEVSSCSASISDIGTQLTTMNTAASGLSALSDMGDNIDTLKTSVAEISAGADTVLPAAKSTITTLETGLCDIQSALDRKGDTSDTMGLIQGMKSIDDGLATLTSGAKTLKSGITTYTDGVSTLNSGLSTIDSNSSALVSGAKQLDSGVSTLSTALSSGVKQLTDGTSALYSGTKTYTKGVSSLNSGLKTIDSNSSALVSGAKKLDSGVATLSTALTSGVKQLTSGTAELYSGTKKLVSNNETLVDGVKQLTDGAEKIADGADQLHEGSVTLGDGITEAKDGAGTLNTALSDGAKEINEVNATDNTYDMFSEPVESQKQEYTTVADNGHAMAPYMMSVGLWVGTLAFCIMYPLSKYHGELKSGFRWWLSKATVLHLLTQVMAVLMLFILHKACGFTPASWSKTIIIACLASIAFMSIQYFMNVALGKVGSFIMLIFMVIQLAGSAGTYPVEISGNFVSKIHSLVPFTYTVDAFRMAIAGKGDITQCCVIMAIIVVVFSTLTVLMFMYRAKCIKTGRRCLYDFIEEKGLA